MLHRANGHVQGGSPDGHPDDSLLPSLAECGKPRPVQWIIPGLMVEGCVNVVQGKKGAGKSVFYAWVIAVWMGLTTDGQGCKRRRTQRRAMIVSEEPYRDMICPRLLALGIDPATVLFAGDVRTKERRRFELPAGAAVIEAAVKRQGVGLVVIDPFDHHLAGGYSANDAGDVRDAIDPLIKLGEDHGVTSVLNQHICKARRETELERGRGSPALAETARCVVQLQKQGSGRTRGVIKNLATNVGGEGRGFAYEVRPVDGGVVFSLGAEQIEGEEVDYEGLKEQSQRTWLEIFAGVIRDELKDGEKDGQELHAIARRMGGHPHAMDDAAGLVGVQYRRMGNGKNHRCIWSLPTAAPKK